MSRFVSIEFNILRTKIKSKCWNHVLCKLNFQRPTVSWKLFSGPSVNELMTADASSFPENGRVTISNNFTLGSGITQQASTNSRWKQSFAIFSDLPMFWISWKKCIIWTNCFDYFSFHVQRHCQNEDSNTTLKKLAWLKWSVCS